MILHIENTPNALGIKSVPVHDMKAYRRNNGKASLIFNLGSSWRWVVQYHASAALPLPRLVGAQSRSRRCHLPGTEPRLLGFPASSLDTTMTELPWLTRRIKTHWNVTFSTCATEDDHAAMSEWVPGGCVTSGDVAGCYVLWHGGAEAVCLRRAPVHRCRGWTVGQVAYRHRRTADTVTTPSALLQVIVQTQGSALWRVLHYPHGWFVG